MKKELEAARGTKGPDLSKIRQLQKKIEDYEVEIALLEMKVKEQEQIIDQHQMIIKREETVARKDYKRVVDGIKAAKEAEKGTNMKLQQQKAEIVEL